MANQKLLIIDELGFVPLSKTGAELLFELISQRYERGATMITSNLPFDAMARASYVASARHGAWRPAHWPGFAPPLECAPEAGQFGPEILTGSGFW